MTGNAAARDTTGKGISGGLLLPVARQQDGLCLTRVRRARRMLEDLAEVLLQTQKRNTKTQRAVALDDAAAKEKT